MGQSITGVRSRGVILDGLTALPAATSVLVVDSAGVMAAQALPVPYSGATGDVDLGENTLFCWQVNLYDSANDDFKSLVASDNSLLFNGQEVALQSLLAGYANLGLSNLFLQPILVSNSSVSPTNYERGYLRWSSNIFHVGTEKGSGGGSARQIHFETDGTLRLLISEIFPMVRFGTSASGPLLYSFTGSSFTAPSNGTGLGLFITPVSGGYGLGIGGNAIAPASGTNNFHVYEALTFAPTSGSAAFASFHASPTINQTGGASGITRGYSVNPSLVSAADWRSFDCTNNTGFAYYATGTAPSQFNGEVRSSSLMCAGAYTVGTLPSASANAGKFAQVTDSSVTTFGSTVAGGGSNRRQVFSDGTNWIID